MRLTPLTCLLAAALAPPLTAQAHPHEFVDTTLVLRLDQDGLLGAISVVWVYDELTSMLIISDMEMDKDGDGNLTEAEAEVLQDLARSWPEGFDGNLHLSQGGASVALSGPLDTSGVYRYGRLVLSHIRALPERIDPRAGLVHLQAYDPTYYIHYELDGTPTLSGGEGCTLTVEPADIPMAQKLYEAAMAELSEEELLDESRYPLLGSRFADVVRLECAD